MDCKKALKFMFDLNLSKTFYLDSFAEVRHNICLHMSNFLKIICQVAERYITLANEVRVQPLDD